MQEFGQVLKKWGDTEGGECARCHLPTGSSLPAASSQHAMVVDEFQRCRFSCMAYVVRLAGFQTEMFSVGISGVLVMASVIRLLNHGRYLGSILLIRR